MADAAGDPGAHFFGGCLQIDEAQFRPGRRAQPLAVDAPQRRAGDDCALAFRELGPDPIEPGPAVRIAQGVTSAHLGPRGLGVEVVAVPVVVVAAAPVAPVVNEVQRVAVKWTPGFSVPVSFDHGVWIDFGFCSYRLQR